MEEYIKGHVFEDLTEDNIDYYAEMFGEGSKALTDLIKFCFENGIKTYSSCKGHPVKNVFIELRLPIGFIAFDFDDDLELGYFLASLHKRIKGIEVNISNFVHDQRKSVTIYVPAKKDGMSDNYFNLIKTYLEEFIKTKKGDIHYEYDDKIVQMVNDVCEYTSDDFYVIKNDKIMKMNLYGSKKVKCPNKDITNTLHKKVCDLLGKPKTVEEFISR